MTETLEPGAGIDWRKRLRRSLARWQGWVCPSLVGIAVCSLQTGEGFPWRLYFMSLIAFALGRIDEWIDP